MAVTEHSLCFLENINSREWCCQKDGVNVLDSFLL